MGICTYCDKFPCDGIILLYSTILSRKHESVQRQLRQQNRVGEITIDISNCPDYVIEGGECESE